MVVGLLQVNLDLDIIASSIDYPEMGEKKGIVRGNIDYGGWLLTPIENNTKVYNFIINRQMQFFWFSLIPRVASHRK